MNKKDVEILYSLWEGGRARVLYYRGFGPARGQVESSWQTVGRYNRIGFLLTNYLITHYYRLSSNTVNNYLKTINGK